MLLKKLVIAEDDDAVAHLVAAGLGDAGFLCIRARDGEEAFNRVRTELPDALVLDVMMPKMDGIEVCKRLKADVILSRIPILLLTSMASVNDRVTGLEAGADDYLPKPFDLRELAARVKAIVRQSRRERDRNAVTNLPGSETLEDRLNDLLGKQESFGVLYLDVENFRAYSEAYGYRKAETVIADMGKIVLDQARAIGEACFVSHLGGDDFIVLCPPDQLNDCGSQIERSCRESIPGHYDEEDRKRGYIRPKVATGQSAEPIQFMNPSVAKVRVDPGRFKNAEELASEITRVKAATRKRTDSGLFRAAPEFSESK